MRGRDVLMLCRAAPPLHHPQGSAVGDARILRDRLEPDQEESREGWRQPHAEGMAQVAVQSFLKDREITGIG